MILAKKFLNRGFIKIQKRMGWIVLITMQNV